MAWTRPSNPFHWVFNFSKSAAISTSLVTSHGSAIYEPSSVAISVTRSLKRSFW
jgi:hypothetical protein